MTVVQIIVQKCFFGFFFLSSLFGLLREIFSYVPADDLGPLSMSQDYTSGPACIQFWTGKVEQQLGKNFILFSLIAVHTQIIALSVPLV